MLSHKSDPLYQQLPESLHEGIYHSLVPLDNPKVLSSERMGYHNSLFKVTSKFDGYCYIVRRFIKCRLSINDVAPGLSPWLKIVHPNVVATRDIFVSSQNDFADQFGSLCFVSDYHAASTNLFSRYFAAPGSLLSENELWSYFLQILSYPFFNPFDFI